MKLHDEIILKAKTQLYKQNSLFWHMMKRIEIHEVKNLGAPGAIGFNPKTRKLMMYFDNESMEKAHNQGDEGVLDVTGLMEHEISHALFYHVFHRPVGKDHKLMNLAQDFIINDTCEFVNGRMKTLLDPEYDGILKGGAFKDSLIKSFPEYENIDLKDTTSLAIYEKLANRKDELLEQFKGFDDHSKMDGDPQDGEGEGKPQQGEGDPKEGKGNGGIDDFLMNQAKAEEIKTTLKRAIDDILKSNDQKELEKLKKLIGKMPGDVQQFVESLLQTKSDFEANLKFFNNMIRSGKFKKTFRKKHRKYDFVKGQQQLKKPNVVIGLDTSGSMFCEKTLKMMLFEIKMYSKLCDNLWVIMGDTDLRSVTRIKNERDFNPEKIDFQGGGGSDMQFIWDFAKENKIDGVICHTDGYISPLDTYKIKSLVGLFDNGTDRVFDGMPNVKCLPILS